MSKILIAGGAGFLGTHLCQTLLNEGHTVYCLDNLSTGYRKNIKDLEQNKQFRFMDGDVRDKAFIDKLHNENFDQIYNLACAASPPLYQSDPIGTFFSSIHGALHLNNLAKKLSEKNGVKTRVLHASTSEVYGNPSEHPQKEEYWGLRNTMGDRACYDIGKAGLETLAYMQRKQGLDIRVVRIFNTYGPFLNPKDGRVVSNFVMQALQGKDITIYGDGSQTRAFQYVSDTIDGLIKLMNHPTFQGPVNIGNPQEITIKTLAETIVELTQTDSKIVYEGLPADDPVRRCPDISLAQKTLGWAPSVSLNEGLKRTIAHFKRHHLSRPKPPLLLQKKHLQSPPPSDAKDKKTLPDISAHTRTPSNGQSSKDSLKNRPI